MKVKIISLISCIVALFLIVRIYTINKIYPAPKQQIYETESDIGANNKDVKFKVKSSKLLSKEDVNKTIPAFYQEFVQEFPEFIGIIVNIEIQNISKQPQYFDLYESLITMNNTYSNGVNLLGVLELNKLADLASIQELKPLSKQEIALFFVIVKENISNKNWEKIDEQEFFLTFNLYPTIKKIKIR